MYVKTKAIRLRYLINTFSVICELPLLLEGFNLHDENGNGNV